MLGSESTPSLNAQGPPKACTSVRWDRTQDLSRRCAPLPPCRCSGALLCCQVVQESLGSVKVWMKSPFLWNPFPAPVAHLLGLEASFLWIDLHDQLFPVL